MSEPLVPVLQCCWVIDPWDPRRDSITRAWSERFDTPVTLWHAGQLGEHAPQGNVTLRHISEIRESGTAQELGFDDACEYELRHRSHACCADLLRYLMVYELGGLYFDLDTLPSPRIHEDFLPRLQDPSTLVVDRVGLGCEIRVVCAVNPHNADLLRVLKEALRRHATFRGDGGYAKHGYSVAEIVARTGPVLMRQVLLERGERSFLGINKGFQERRQKHSARRVIRHTDFRKAENVGTRRDEVLAIAGGER